jgi:catechol 2,3-dioxygenase-like lactoylglutathione lyase family enzyme
MTVNELRLVLTVDDFDAAVHRYRDVLGLPVAADFSGDDGRVLLLAAGRATIELTDARHAEFVDVLETGEAQGGRVRLAFEVDHCAGTAAALAAAGAESVAEPTRTPWDSLNARLHADGVQLTLFEELG